MPLTDQDIRALTYLAIQCRPPHAPRWDDAGTYAAIAKVRHLNLADVALATIRAAADPGAQTPGVIANPQAPNWTERSTVRTHLLEPYDAGSFCGTCNQPEHRCRAHVRPDHEFVTATAAGIRAARDRQQRQEKP